MAGTGKNQEDSGFLKNRPVLVTGCTGFLGSRLTAALVHRGARVVGLVRDQVPASPFFLTGLAQAVTVVHGALEDYALLERTLNEYEIDTVFHLAAQSIVGVANHNPLSTFQTNIQGTWNVLEACRRSPRVAQVVVASSDKAYGAHDRLPYAEDFPLRGNHPYDVSKSCADLIATAYHNTYGIPVCITRCANLFGGGDFNFSRIVPGTIRSAHFGERPIIRSDGSPLRDYVHVSDVVEGYLVLASRRDEDNLHGKAFNLGSGQPISVLDITRKILHLMERQDLEPDIRNEARSEIPQQYLSSELAQRMLGWRPAAPLDQRLKETVRWYRDYFSGARVSLL